MPLQGHWERQTTPLRRLTTRERTMVLAGVLVTIVAIAALLVVFGNEDQPAPGPGCIRAEIAHVMGAEQLNACGARARSLCADAATDNDPNAGEIRGACREAGLPLR
jgi:type II secretory pathway component PulM